jgi:hypothetical protein
MHWRWNHRHTDRVQGPVRVFSLAVVLFLTACTAAGSPDDPVTSDDTPVPPAGGSPAVLVVSGDHDANEPGMSVSQALGHRATDDLISVAGALFVNADGTVLLCEAIAESFPPQCGGQRLEVRGLDLSTIDRLQREGEVQWAESVVLFGSVE